MHHARVAAVVAGLVVAVGTAVPWLGGVEGELATGIETPYGEVAALLGVAVVVLAGTGDVRGWRGGVVLTLGFGAMATTFPTLAGRLAGGIAAEVFVCLLGGATAIACGAYGAGRTRAAAVARSSRSPAPETSASE